MTELFCHRGSCHKDPGASGREALGRGLAAASLTSRLLRHFGKGLSSASHRRVTLIAHTWHLSFHFFKLLSQLPSFDPYRKPMRQAEEVINGHSSQFSSCSQQVDLEQAPVAWLSCCPRMAGWQGGRVAKVLPSPHVQSPEREQTPGKMVMSLIPVGKEESRAMREGP